MRSTWFTRGARTVLALTALAVIVGVTPAAAKPKPGVKRASSNLFALTAAIMEVNHQYCPVINTGNVCTDPSGSGVIEGGFWPKGTPDSYIFNSGLQIGGTIPASAGIPWAGDTVGAFFMDPRGDQQDGSPLTLVSSSLDAGDAASWPSPEGSVTDTGVYSNVLLGLNSVSQQDLWFRAWDGNPTKLGGRAHPMGVLVETRGMAWNYPSGNEDVIYFVYTFTNVTSSVAADYANPSIPNQNPTYLNNLAALGTQFQQLNQTKYGFAFPAHGYEFDNVFAAFFEDCDVGTDHVAQNYSTPVFPFNMGVCYEAPFNEPSWTAAGSFTPSIFTPPTFFIGPGFTSVKYLKSPTDNAGNPLGLVMFSNTLNSATGYPDPVGIKQMYRYLSGTSSPAAGDNPCSFQGEQQALRYCYLAQVSQDTRFFESSGPFTLLPGQAKTIVVAYINAPAVNTPYLQTQVGGDFKPGFGATGDSIAKDSTKVRQIERVMGWVTQNDANADGIIEENEVSVVPRSLLDKANVAQAVFNAKFLLPFAPVAPEFFLIPGDNQVTIVWQRSPTEDPVTGGDPYYVIASNPIAIDPLTHLPGANPLYDPNFRRFDVEGYRIYRGRTAGQMTLVAQFDYTGTQMVDYTGQFDWGNCAPELGVNGPTVANPAGTPGNTCPQGFDSTSIADAVGTPVSLVGNVIQIPIGGRVKLSDGSVYITSADTAVSGGASGLPALSDNGVTFAYVDRSVRNLFQYFYAVTAFDVNSIKSGPTSLESARATKTVTPRAAGATSAAAGQLGSLRLLAADGSTLNGGAALPTLDATTGEFSGPMPPTDGLQLGFAAFIPELIDSGTMILSIDSVLPGINAIDFGLAQPSTYYLTGSGSHFTAQLAIDQTTGTNTVNGTFPGAKITHGANYGGDTTYSLLAQVSLNTPGPWQMASQGRAAANGNPTGNVGQSGPRWWAGSANENTAAPNANMCAQPATLGACTRSPALLAQTGGSLPNVTTVAPLIGYATVRSVPGRDVDVATSTVYRAADFSVYWGNAGAIDSVIDDTHKVPVPFSPNVEASWGILDSTSFVGIADDPDGNPNVITWSDEVCPAPLNSLIAASLGEGCANPAPMRNTAHLGATATATGNFGTVPGTQAPGFIFYLTGQFWLMTMPALPAAGTVWHARYFAGNVTGSAGSYAFVEAANRPPAISGLRAAISYTASAPISLNTTSAAQLALVHTVPDPYYVTNALEITPNNKVLKFVNLPPQAIVRIYSVSGILVQVLTHNDPTGGGELDWDLRNRSNQFVASGVYFYHVEAADGKTKVGRFTVVQFAP